jgi:hypothetical protein
LLTQRHFRIQRSVRTQALANNYDQSRLCRQSQRSQSGPTLWRDCACIHFLHPPLSTTLPFQLFSPGSVRIFVNVHARSVRLFAAIAPNYLVHTILATIERFEILGDGHFLIVIFPKAQWLFDVTAQDVELYNIVWYSTGVYRADEIGYRDIDCAINRHFKKCAWPGPRFPWRHPLHRLSS